MRSRYSLLSALLLLCPLVALCGCEREVPEVKSYSVEHPKREAMRLLTAIVPAGQFACVVKLSGPEDEVAAQKPAFDKFIGSIRVDEKNEKALPTWTAPAGWKEQPASKMRLATFRIDAPRPIEVAVSLLPPIKEGRGENSLVDNVNRWLGQLDLPAADPMNLDRWVKRIQVDGREVLVADMTGSGVYRRPAEQKAAPADPHAGLPKLNLPKLGKGNQGNLPFRYKAPDAWEPLRPLPAFSSEAFQVAEGKARAKITLSLVQGSVVENVSRWRDQLGLPAAKAAEVEKDIRPMRVAGKEGHYVDLANPAAANRILGVIVPTHGTNLFIKMSGPSDLVGRQKTNFEAFVESFQPARD